MEDIEIIKKSSIKKKKNLIGIIFSCIMIITVIGISYAYFGYYKEGLYTHTFNGGKMDVIYDEITGNNISISDAYPLTDKEALTEGSEFEFTITGYNESKKNVYYAIEMEYGNTVSGKTRFKDSNMKLSLYENDKIVIENEIFDNLNDQGIYYGYIKSGTTEASPTINNYKLRMWINDNVYVSNTIEDDTTLWDDDDFNWAYKNLSSSEIEMLEEGRVTKLSNLGISVYQTSVFGSLYGSFRIKVTANLDGEGIGALMYDANGGEYTPKNTYLTTNMVTMQKPVMENKAFLGWSSKKDAAEVEYLSGDYYSGTGKLLYAVYGDTRNVMGTFPEEILSIKEQITEVNFINDRQENIDEKYNLALENTLALDLTLNNQGSVKGWIELGNYDEENSIQYLKLYVGSEGTTYLTDCHAMFANWINLSVVDFSNVDTSMVTDMSYMFGDDIEEKNTDSWTESTSSLNKKNNLSFISDMKPMAAWYVYMNVNNISEMDISSFNTVNVTNFEWMFGARGQIGEVWEILIYNVPIMNLDLSTFDTSSATNMANMFGYCLNLTNLDISNFDTSNVTNMEGMFYGLLELDTLKIDGINTSKVTNMSGMFNNCNVRNIDVSEFDTSQVIDMSYMFRNTGLSELNLSTFDTGNVTNMSYMLADNEFTSLDLSSFDTSKVTNMEGMFFHALEYYSTVFDIKHFDTSNVTNMSYMFSGCTNLKNFSLSNFDTGKVTNMEEMFSNSELEIIDLSNKDLSNVTNMNSMFSGWGGKNLLFENCSMNTTTTLTEFINYAQYIKKISFKGSTNLIPITFHYNECRYAEESLEYVDFSDCDFGTRTSLSNLFSFFDSMKEVDFSNSKMPNITSLKSFFSGTVCEKVSLNNVEAPSIIDFTNLFVSSDIKIVDMSGMSIENATSLSSITGSGVFDTIDMSGMNISNVTKISNFGSAEINFLNLSNMTMGSLTSLASAFRYLGAKKVDFTGFDTSKVTDMSYMFECTEFLTTIDLSNFDTSNVTNMLGMFSSCKTLKKLDLSMLDMSKVKRMTQMFSGCENLEQLDISAFTFSSSLTYYTYIFSSTGLSLGDGIYTKVYVKSSTEQSWVLNQRDDWTTDNVIIKR